MTCRGSICFDFIAPLGGNKNINTAFSVER